MPVILILFLAFTVLPAIELTLLWKAHQQWGTWQTLAIVVLTGALGARLSRSQGADAWRNVRNALAAGRIPTDEMGDAVMILVAGVVLLTPGFVTDVFGLMLLIPPCRALVRRALAREFKRRVSVHTVSMSTGQGTRRRRDEGVIDISATDVTEKPD